MRKFFRIYKPFTHAGILLAAQYRLNFIFFILGDILACFINYFLWIAVFSANGTGEFMGFTQESMVMYVFLSFLTTFLVYSDVAYPVGEEIRDGSIVMRMIKPIRFDLSLLFQELGDSAVTMGFVFIPILLGIEIYRFVATGAIRFNIVNFLLYFLSVLFGYLINFYFNICYGYSAFFLKYIWGSNMLKNTIVGFLSGSILPIAFMPGPMAAILNFLPFASLCYNPVMIYLGMYSPVQILWSFALQIFWLLFFYFLQKVIWNACVKRLSSQGG